MHVTAHYSTVQFLCLATIDISLVRLVQHSHSCTPYSPNFPQLVSGSTQLLVLPGSLSDVSHMYLHYIAFTAVWKPGYHVTMTALFKNNCSHASTRNIHNAYNLVMELLIYFLNN